MLLVEAANTGPAPIVNPRIPALTRARLSHVDQNYVRAETVARANARLVDAQADIPLAQLWGEGLVASVDGMRFVVPVRTINAAPNPRYFGTGRGLTWLNYLSDQVTGFASIVVHGTVRNSLLVLDGLLDNQSSLEPEIVITDTAASSDMVFGLFRLLGYQVSPRLADLSDQRFWRLRSDADYGPLADLGRHRVDERIIAANWDEMLRIAGSLQTRTVRACNLLRALQAGGKPTAAGRAVAEYGKPAKTLHLLAYLDNAGYRRRIEAQLALQERRHSLARALFHGRRGRIHQRYREGQEDQLEGLGFVLNAIVLWNARYLDAALTELRRGGEEVNDDARRLNPLSHDHINLHGRYHFPAPPETGVLRPLRDPDQPDDDEP